MSRIVSCKITVFFDDTFWVGTYELTSENKLEVAKFTFGAEPKDYEVYAYLLQNRGSLRFSPIVNEDVELNRKINPKRVQKTIRQQLGQTGLRTKAQEALRLQQEQNKIERKKYNRAQAEAEKEKKFELRQIKKKEKNRGH